MLFNHAPLVIAEQFGTLASIYPGRIDFGSRTRGRLRHPQRTHLQRSAAAWPSSHWRRFPKLVAELQLYLGSEQQDQMIRAYPGQKTHVPIYLLSSSGYNAQLAGELGLPLACATHIKPNNLIPSVNLYREHFRPSKVLSEPYVMVTALALAAETDEEAHKSFTCAQQLFLAAIRALPQNSDPRWTVWTGFGVRRKGGGCAKNAVGNTRQPGYCTSRPPILTSADPGR